MIKSYLNKFSDLSCLATVDVVQLFTLLNVIDFEI